MRQNTWRAADASKPDKQAGEDGDNAKFKVLKGFENEWQKYDEQVND